ncbi:MAG: phosphoglycerate kinase [Gemmatimonadetes bacterium]|jgi:phosphoglycerate kinase|nr:phosphoglycerate kinase [Gemmatimonadota bacterium]
MAKMTVKDVDVAGKRVLVRVDFNVPLDDDQKITNDNRIQGALPTIQYLLEQGAAVILMSHLGRPKGKKVPEMSLAPAAERLGELLGKEVKLASDCIGPEVEKLAGELQAGEVLVLENLRFYAEEEGNDAEFAEKLAALGDLYVNDAFGTAHRAHASTEGVAHFLSTAASGMLMEKEITYLDETLKSPERPFAAILGGAKISGKIEVIENLLDKVDALIIGGGMAYTFFKAMGLEIGNSLLEEDRIEVAKQVMADAEKKSVDLLLPVDCVVADDFAADANTQTVAREQMPVGWEGVDIGPQSRELFGDKVRQARTVAWNGPMGVFEMEPFAAGTLQVAEALAEASEKGTVSIIGGGDTAAAVIQAGLSERMTHISTGGGASLECMGGRVLPGVAALTEKEG